jgi:alanine dehydrogenase
LRVGVVKEVKAAERRVAITPAGVRELVADGHEVLVETGAGLDSGYDDGEYRRLGARMVGTREVWRDCELLVKVKEPVESEYEHLRPDLILFTFLHLAPNRPLLESIVDSGVCAIAYETVKDAEGHLPLLTPMSEIAGRLATLAAAFYLQAPAEVNAGMLIGGAPGVPSAKVLVLGGGSAGTQAARMAAGMGAEVTILELSLPRIRQLEDLFDGRVRVLVSDAETIEEQLRHADVVVGAVLVPGARAPKLIRRKDLGLMKSGSVLADVAIDQGGCAESSRGTTHASPTYVVEGVTHYCVTNIPGAVPATSTRALTNATLPYIRKLARLGIDAANAADPGLAAGTNVRDGEILCEPVADAYWTKMPEGAVV